MKEEEGKGEKERSRGIGDENKRQQHFRERMVTIGDDAVRSAAERVIARRSDPFSAINRLAN